MSCRPGHYRLGVLNQMVGSVEPRPIVWENIRSELARTDFAQETPAPEVRRRRHLCPSSPRSKLHRLSWRRTPCRNRSRSLPKQSSPGRRGRHPDAIPDIAPIFMPQVHAPDPDVVRAPPAPVADNSNVIRLEGRVKRWRTIASAVGALAAALLVTLSLQIFQPDALPGGLRPAPRIQTVEVKTPAAPLTAAAQYVALLQGQGGGPAFILTVDGATGISPCARSARLRRPARASSSG